VNLSPALFGLSLADFVTRSFAQRIIDYVVKRAFPIVPFTERCYLK
jgi:hypothetical protein